MIGILLFDTTYTYTNGGLPLFIVQPFSMSKPKKEREETLHKLSVQERPRCDLREIEKNTL